MSDQDQFTGGSVTLGAHRDLTRVAGANLLVSRALVDIVEQTRALNRIGPSFLRDALEWYYRGAEQVTKHDKACHDLTEAIRLFDQAIQLDPGDAFAVRHRAKAYFWCGLTHAVADDEAQLSAKCKSLRDESYDRAMKDFAEAIRLAPTDALGYVERSAARGDAPHGDPDCVKEMQDLTDAIRIDPHNPRWYALRGVRRLELSDYENAVQDLNDAISLNASGESHVAIVFTETGDESDLDAEEYDGSGNPTASASIRINLHECLARGLLGRGRRRFGKSEYEKAIHDLSETIRLDGQQTHNLEIRGISRRAHGLRARAWFNERQYDKTIEDCDAAIALDPHAFERHLARSPSTFANVMAASFSKTATAEYMSLALLRGKAWAAKWNYDKAIEDFGLAIRLGEAARGDDDGIAALSYYHRGKAWLKKWDYDRAIEDLSEAIRRRAPNAAMSYSLRGDAWYAKEVYGKALEDHDHAIRLDPSNAVFFNNRGIAWSGQGNLEKAIEDYTEALRLEQNAVFFLNRAEAWSSKNEDDNAITDYDAAIRLEPTATRYVARAKFWLAKMQYARAIADYDEAIRQRKERVDKLQSLNAPEIIIRNELRMLGDLEQARTASSSALMRSNPTCQPT
jgi:tetratricopeptide (TPR) repeat protein